MIHHHDFDPHGIPCEPKAGWPPAGLSPHEKTINDHIMSLAHTITEEHLSHVENVFALAILKANDGVLPTDEEIDAWSNTLIGADGTYHLLWKAPKMEAGDKVDMSYVIASVEPPVK